MADDLARTANGTRVLIWIRGPYATPEFVAKLPQDEGYSGLAESLEGVGPTKGAAILDLEAQLEAIDDGVELEPI